MTFVGGECVFDRAKERLMFDFVHPINWPMEGPFYAGAVLFGYLLGSIPFGLIFTYLVRRGRCAQDRLGQYRRDECAAHGKAMGGGRDAHLRRRQGRGCGADRARVLGSDMAVFAALGAFLGHCFPCGSASRAAKVLPHSLGVLLALYWPVGLMARGDMADRGADLPHLVVVRADRGSAHARLHVADRTSIFTPR